MRAEPALRSVANMQVLLVQRPTVRFS